MRISSSASDQQPTPWSTPKIAPVEKQEKSAWSREFKPGETTTPPLISLEDRFRMQAIYTELAKQNSENQTI